MQVDFFQAAGRAPVAVALRPLTVDPLPSYAELPVGAGAPPGSSWGVWGDDDGLGTLNLLGPEHVQRAITCVRTGRVFPLDVDMALLDPPLFSRTNVRHDVLTTPRGSHDDVLSDFNTQSSSQWDGFRHYRHPVHGHYAGLPGERHGILQWAERGIVTRAVLADVDRWRAAHGRALRHDESYAITVDDLTACLRDRGASLERPLSPWGP